MLHAIVIGVLLVVLIRDELGALFLGDLLGPGAVVGVTLAVHAAIWAVADVLIRRDARTLDRTGRIRAAWRAERWLTVSRVAAALWHAFAVLGLGWLDAVRRWTGDLVVIDELAAVLPVGLVLTLGWWSIYPIHRRLREAVLVRELDEGRPVYPILSRAKFVWSNVRHHLAMVGVPVAVLAAWSEAVERGMGWLAATRWAQELATGEAGGWGALVLAPRGLSVMIPALQFSGTIFVFALLPVLMRRVWDTLPLGAGPLRDRLIDLCRAHGVGVRDLLVWRTNGSMINGAVMGVAGPVRYILLTDALLDALPEDQVRAVMAHEIGHVRRRHMLWLLIAAAASWVGVTVTAGWIAEAALGGVAVSERVEGLVTAGTLLAALTVGLIVFGFASRRFEWQADAFAVQHLSGAGRSGREPVLITEEAVATMSGALDTVATLNAMPRERFSWRHGSIADRQRRLRLLVGQRADRLAVDRQAWRVKVVSLAALAAAGAMAAADVAGVLAGG